MSSKLVIMEEEAFRILTSKMDKLTDEVKKLNARSIRDFRIPGW